MDRMEQIAQARAAHAAEAVVKLEMEAPMVALELLEAVRGMKGSYLRAKAELEEMVKTETAAGGLICWDYERMSFKYGINLQVPAGEVREHFHRDVDGVRVKREGNPYEPETWGEYLD